MLKIIKSLFVIVAVSAVAAGATGAYFTDSATIAGNTFSTGVLEIRVNGEPSIIGANFSPMAPDQIGDSPEYDINNYGAPSFAGPSNLSAKRLLLTAGNHNDDGSGLWGAVRVKIEVNRGWDTWQEAFNGRLADVRYIDLLSPRWTELAPGDSERIRYQIWLPNSDYSQESRMGKTLTWDFVVEGRTN